MARQVTKAAENRYCQSRLRAAKWNEKLLTRNGAAEVLGCVTEESLKKYEGGWIHPPNDVVALMADAYNEPELRSWYCAHECPLGKDRVAEICDMPPERTAIRMQRQLGVMGDALEEFAEMVEDGVISPDELQRVPALKKQFLDARSKVDEMLAAIEKIENRGGYPEIEGR